MSNTRYVLGIGSVNLDIMGRSTNPLIQEDSNPGCIELSVGGVTHNICENASRLGTKVNFITATGDDHFSQIIKSAFVKQGIPTDNFVTICNASSSIYMSVHNTDGEMNVAVSDMSVLQHLSVSHLIERKEIIENAGAIVFDTGLPLDIIQFIVSKYGRKIPIFADPVSTNYAKKLLDNLDGIFVLKPSLMEAEILSGITIDSSDNLIKAAEIINNKGVDHVFISLGSNGIFYRSKAGKSIYRKNQPVSHILNTTGAGDSFMGALLYSYINKIPVEEAIRISMAVSSITIMSEHTICPELNEAYLMSMLDTFAECDSKINDLYFDKKF